MQSVQAIKDAFSRLDVLSDSFLTSDRTGGLLGVDLNECRESLGVLWGSNDEVKNALVSGIEVALVKLNKTSHTWRLNESLTESSPSIPMAKSSSSLNFQKISLRDEPNDLLDEEKLTTHLRPVIVILQLPFLTDPDIYLNITRRLALSLASLHKSVKRFLVVEIARAYLNDAPKFVQLIAIFRRVICEHYAVRSQSVGYYITNDTKSRSYTNNHQLERAKESIEEDGVIASIRVLSMLYNANEYSAKLTLPTSRRQYSVERSPVRTIVPFWAFYCTTSPDEFSKLLAQPALPAGLEAAPLSSLPVKVLYFTYVALHGNPALLSSYFSLLNYPFLLDPAFKTRIVRVESVSWMTGEFEDAFIKQGLTQTMRRVASASSFDGSDSDVVQGRSSALNRMETAYSLMTSPYLVLEIRREQLVKDTLDQLAVKWVDLHKPLKVKFVGEEGLDQGGVQKEFFQLILEEIFDPGYGLFLYDIDTRLAWLNGFSLEREKIFELAGLILGLAIYNGVIVNLPLPRVFYKKLLHETRQSKNGLYDLGDIADLYPQTYDGLKHLLLWNESEQGTVEDVFCRNFDIDYDVYGEKKSFELVANGAQIPVTGRNRDEYVDLYVTHLVETSIKGVFMPLRDGFWRVVGGPKYLKWFMSEERTRQSTLRFPCSIELFRPEELALLMTGLSSSDDRLYSSDAFQAIKSSARYEDFSPESRVIKWFWDIVLQQFTNDQRRKLLWFVTGSDRIPLGGLKEIVMVIQRNGVDGDRLPTSLTCFTRLLIPEFNSMARLKQFLSMAIEESKGFGLV